METIDLTKVAEAINPDDSRLPYNTHGHLFTKVAFDVFKLNNSPVESYWILEKAEDGKEYLVADYERGASDDLSAQSDWEALSDKTSSNVTLLYKGVPIKRFASSQYNFDESDASVFKDALVDKLTKDKEFVGKLMEILPEDKKSALSGLFPELVS